jgi:cytochrome c oxidase accessory protein FixG
MCPYSRFQAAMTDEHSLVVSYEVWRGEPRGTVKGHPSFEGRGHCVDCGMCVQSCPTGIDIRRGSQLACIGCGLCVDACNKVMDRFGLPRGLISYDSNANMLLRGQRQPTRNRVIRPRTMIYAGVLAAAGSVMLASLLTRTDLKVDVLHGRSPLAVLASGHMSRNAYDYKVLNMASHPRTFSLKLADMPDARLEVVGLARDVTEAELKVAADSVGSFRVYVTARMTPDGKNRPLLFDLTETREGKEVRSESFFAMPEE